MPSRCSRLPVAHFDLAPTEVLSKVMKDAGRPYGVKVYPPYGSSAADGHTLRYFGFSVWGDDVMGFLAEHCSGAPRGL
jgi:hypothetical protein